MVRWLGFTIAPSSGNSEDTAVSGIEEGKRRVGVVQFESEGPVLAATAVLGGKHVLGDSGREISAEVYKSQLISLGDTSSKIARALASPQAMRLSKAANTQTVH